MNLKEPNIKDVSSVYPPIRIALGLSSKHFMEIIEEQLTENVSPFIAVKFLESSDSPLGIYYIVYAEFFYKGVRYTASCSVNKLTTETVVETYFALKNEIRHCMKERD